MTQDIQSRLAAPFPASAVKARVGRVAGNRASALFYIDARLVQDRLDQVMGLAGWKDDYELLPSGSVVCRLSLKIGDEWITKVDVGKESKQPEGGDRTKASFSDALKRCAVKFGVGRYLYALGTSWHDYDPQKKAFVRPPTLPAGAPGTGKTAGSTPPRTAAPHANGHARPDAPAAPPRLPKPFDRNHDAAELISPDHAAWLEQLAADKGYTPASILRRYSVVHLEDLTYAQYRESVASLEKIQRRVPA